MSEDKNGHAQAQPPTLYEALKALYEHDADYIRINHLGHVHHNQSMQMARDALAAARPAEQPAPPPKRMMSYSGAEPHEECPDCRGLCDEVPAAQPSAPPQHAEEADTTPEQETPGCPDCAPCSAEARQLQLSLQRLSMALGNPALTVNEDESFESALIEFAAKRLEEQQND